MVAGWGDRRSRFFFLFRFSAHPCMCRYAHFLLFPTFCYTEVRKETRPIALPLLFLGGHVGFGFVFLLCLSLQFWMRRCAYNLSFFLRFAVALLRCTEAHQHAKPIALLLLSFSGRHAGFGGMHQMQVSTFADLFVHWECSNPFPARKYLRSNLPWPHGDAQ